MARLAITNEQRKALRRWYRSQTPPPSQKQCKDWFELTYARKISQSTVSESLSNRFNALDTSSNDTGRRQRTAKWPILENILSDYQKSVESQGLATNGQILQEKAREIWHQIPQYQGLPVPEFSTGWLDKFKQRQGIASHIQPGEAALVPITAEAEMKAVRTICGEYQEDDIYNMDETGLNWRSAVNRGLLSAPTPGRKQEKSRITLNLCTNATGSDRLPVWIIGHAEQPRALRGLNYEAIGCRWRNNKKACMTTVIMVEWLTAFYQHIGSRSVILCMDSLKAHIDGVEIAPPPSNIHIIWLPKTSTSTFQPLEQGIIQNMKAHYRKAWIGYIITSIDHGIDPFTSVTLYHTLHWCVEAWYHEVDDSTIHRSFRKSSLIPPAITVAVPVEADLSIEYLNLQQRLDDVADLGLILHPEGEDERHRGDEETSLEEMIERHAGTDATPPDEHALLEDVEPDPRLLPTTAQALDAVRLLAVFLEHQASTQHRDIQFLRHLERELCTIAIHGQD